MNKLSLTTKLSLLLLLPLVAVAFFGYRTSWEKWCVYRDYVALDQNSAVLQQIGNTVHELQKERGRTAGFLSSKGTQFTNELRGQRETTDAKVRQLHELMKTFDAQLFGDEFGGKLRVALADLQKVSATRESADKLAVTAVESTAYYSRTISQLLDVIVAMSHLSKDAAIGNGISCYVNFLEAKEQAGIERAGLTGVFAAGQFSGDGFYRVTAAQAAQRTFLRVFESFATDAQKQFANEKVSGPAVEAVEVLRRTAREKASTGGFGVASAEWFDASTRRIDLMKEVEDRLAADYEKSATEIKLAARREFGGLAITTVAVLLLTAAATWWLLRTVTRGILAIAVRLGDGSREVSSASTQVSAASQHSAAGASEQAASLEETSASLEELSSMTKRNAEAAAQAKALAADTRTAADSGCAEMVEMKVAVEAIQTSGRNIAKIIKSIDEIAFQTNLLALNAAVEAARAGESGAGFAVVADEVRSLAQRSALAARETAEKIEESVRTTDRGVQISTRVAQHFSEIATKTRHMDTLVTEIAGASTEQMQGINQVNTAVAQMDKVTQASAAGAEETAAQAEELDAQAAELTGVINQLKALVEGASRSAEVDAVSSAEQAPRARRSFAGFSA